MGMEKILEMLGGVQSRIRTSAGPVPSSPADHNLFEAAKKINDHVFEICKPARPSVEIVFFHGLQLKDSSSSDAHLHINTWISTGNQPELWLKWLLQENYFPDARILVISYDASPKREHDRGRMDMYTTSENLIHSLIGGKVQLGQHGCPVVLVGHCLGGLIMKELCFAANAMLSLNSPDEPNEPVEKFLKNVKGVFTYASPHRGSRLADINTKSQRGPLFESLTTLNTDAARRKEHFRNLRNKYKWKSFGVAESVEVTLDLGSLSFTGLVVEEASAREDVDDFCTINADHFSVCRPSSTTSNSFQHLSNFISTVVEKHGAIRSPNMGLLANPKMVGLAARVDNVLLKLRDTRRLGIVGLGAIGKTTLAKAVYEQISGEFDYACFLEEIKTKMTKEETPYVLREKIKEKLKQNGEDDIVSKSFNWSRLRRKKVLIVLDDAEFASHVNVMTVEDDFSEESRVIVTSRRREFLRQESFVIHDAEALDLDDSKRLFCQHVFGQPGVPPNSKKYEARVTNFAKKCGGLPLALEVAGSHLRMYQDNKAIWDETLKKLSLAKSWNGQHEDGLWSILGVIIDGLADAEREMFMDVATCFHGHKLSEVQEAWKACSWTDGTAELGWHNLLDRCLVSKDLVRIHGAIDRVEYVRMHELFRDLGRNRAGNSRVSDIQQLRDLREEEKPKVKILALTLSRESWFRKHPEYKEDSYPRDRDKDDKDGDHVVGAGVLSALKELEVLWLEHVDLPSEPINGDFQALHALSFSWCSSFDAAFFSRGQVQALKCLTIKGQYPFKRLPESARQLTHLQIEHCSHLEVLPCIAQPTVLQQLKIHWCDGLKVVPWMAQLTAVQHLEFESCNGLESLPCIGKLKALENFVIGYCSSLKDLPESIGQLTALERMKIGYCRLKALPSSIGQLHALEHLNIIWCTSLEELPESIGQLKALKCMKITECNSMVALPSSLGQLTALEHMKFKGCESLKALPSTIGGLCALQNMKIKNCRSFIELPEGVGQLQALRYLELDALHLKTLPDTLGKLHKLEYLRMSSMFGLEKFPDIFGQLTALQELYLAFCDDLVAPPNLSRQLDALKKLSINCCRSTTETPDWARQHGVDVFFRNYQPPISWEVHVPAGYLPVVSPDLPDKTRLDFATATTFFT